MNVDAESTCQELGSCADRVTAVCPTCHLRNGVTTACWWVKQPDGTVDHTTMDNQEVNDPDDTCEHFLELVRDGDDAYLTFREPEAAE